jgi:hypothetical protein
MPSVRIAEFYVHMTVHRNQFLYNKINRRTNFQIHSGTKLYMFRAVSLPVNRRYLLYIRHWHILYSFYESFRVGPGRNGSSILVLHASCRQTYITCASAECTVDNSWWQAEELPETYWVSYQNKSVNYCVCWFYCKEE